MGRPVLLARLGVHAQMNRSGPTQSGMVSVSWLGATKMKPPPEIRRYGGG
jgi:hypothetical protein